MLCLYGSPGPALGGSPFPNVGFGLDEASTAQGGAVVSSSAAETRLAKVVGKLQQNAT